MIVSLFLPYDIGTLVLNLKLAETHPWRFMNYMY